MTQDLVYLKMVKHIMIYAAKYYERLVSGNGGSYF